MFPFVDVVYALTIAHWNGVSTSKCTNNMLDHSICISHTVIKSKQEQSNMGKRLPTVEPTPAQRKWLEKRKKQTKKSYADIMRDLIQAQIDKGI